MYLRYEICSNRVLATRVYGALELLLRDPRQIIVASEEVATLGLGTQELRDTRLYAAFQRNTLHVTLTHSSNLRRQNSRFWADLFYRPRALPLPCLSDDSGSGTPANLVQ